MMNELDNRKELVVHRSYGCVQEGETKRAKTRKVVKNNGRHDKVLEFLL